MPTAVLRPHALLIAAIFVPYMGLMLTLAVYIYRTGQPRSTVREDKPPDSDDDESDRDLPLAA